MKIIFTFKSSMISVYSIDIIRGRSSFINYKILAREEYLGEKVKNINGELGGNPLKSNV